MHTIQTCLTLLVSYQSGASSSPSSSPSSDSDPIPVVVDIFRGVFHSRIKNTPFRKLFPSIAIYPMVRFIAWNLTTQCLAVTGGGSVGECDRLSQPSSLLDALEYS